MKSTDLAGSRTRQTPSLWLWKPCHPVSPPCPPAQSGHTAPTPPRAHQSHCPNTRGWLGFTHTFLRECSCQEHSALLLGAGSRWVYFTCQLKLKQPRLRPPDANPVPFQGFEWDLGMDPGGKKHIWGCPALGLSSSPACRQQGKLSLSPAWGLHPNPSPERTTDGIGEGKQWETCLQFHREFWDIPMASEHIQRNPDPTAPALPGVSALPC